jgi:hypothetical protein
MKSKDQMLLEQIYSKILDEEVGSEMGSSPKAQVQQEIEGKVKQVEQAIDGDGENTEDVIDSDEESEEEEEEEGTGPQTPLEKKAENILDQDPTQGLSDEEMKTIENLIKQN